MAYNHALAFAWDEAMKIWMELVKGDNAKEVACAAFNMSVACEMQGNFELAQKWLDLSQKHLIFRKQNITEKFCKSGKKKNAVLKKRYPRIHKTVVSLTTAKWQ
jgi:hypothetical protein